MTKRILSIDGGGLRGVFAAAVIEQMEHVNGGRPACEIFDCFCGTSAGAVLAAGLAAGRTAGEMKRMFIDLGTTMAALMTGGGNGDAARMRVVRQQAAAALEEQLRHVFGPDLLPSQLKRRLAIPARNMKLGRVVFFGNFPEDQLNEPSFWDDSDVDENEPVWKIVRRSTALPPLFAPAGPYLDGGVSPFANPTYAAYEGVQRRLGWNPHQQRLRFFSVGTGYHRTQVANLAGLDDTGLSNVMVDAMMQDINFLQHQVMKRRSGEGTIWYRRYNISFDRKGFERFGLPVADEAHFAKLALTATPLIQELAEIGTKVGEQTVEPQDFQPLEPIPDRRTRERRRRPDRRSGEAADVTDRFADRRSNHPRRRRLRRVLSTVVPHPSVPERAIA